jgi:8-oxo-dGTP pyrophosphatase MutT (NUDIX family)
LDTRFAPARTIMAHASRSVPGTLSSEERVAIVDSDKAHASRSVPGTLSSEERVAIVDSDNNVVGSSDRGTMRAAVLPHRATFVFITNSAGCLAVQKRTAVKDFCPSYFDVCAGGVVGDGESYEENARREAMEEMGVDGDLLQHIKAFYVEQLEGPVNTQCRCHGDIWACEYDGQLTLQQEEVESCEFLRPEEAMRRAAEGMQFCPDGLVALRHFLEHRQANARESAPVHA